MFKPKTFASYNRILRKMRMFRGNLERIRSASTPKMEKNLLKMPRMNLLPLVLDQFLGKYKLVQLLSGVF